MKLTGNYKLDCSSISITLFFSNKFASSISNINWNSQKLKTISILQLLFLLKSQINVYSSYI